MRYLLALCLTLTSAASTYAQSDTATLTVNVADTSSAIVPGATVAVRHLDRNAIRELVSDEEGGARFVMLPPGLYEAEHAVLFDAFLRPRFERGDLPQLPGKALAHIHCHQQSIAGRDATAEALGAAGLDADVLDAGCCGMAGAFGFDKRHYKVAMAIGERRLLPAVRAAAAADTVVIADGFSCRQQILHATGRQPFHFAEVVWRGIRGTR